MPCLLTDQNFANNFWKRVTPGTFLWNYFKIWQVVSEEKNFEEFLWSPHNEKSPPWQPCFSTNQNSANNFWKRVTQGTTVWNYFKIWQAVSEEKNFEEFLWSPQSEKSLSPTNGGHVFWRIKISWTTFEKGHTRNKPVKWFQNLTGCFKEEEFWRISLKSTQWKKPLPHQW